MEENKELALAWEYICKTSKNVFLTGKAGTGKTTFLKRVVDECPKRKIVLAPTGVAAINAGGMTLHSFFQLPFGLFLPEFQHVQAHDKQGRYKFHRKKRQLIKSLELMIIDEVSMLRADVMDELDLLLRKIRHSDKPFGGVQLLMIGDIQQLSPVVKEDEWAVMGKYYPSPYFFDAKVLQENDYRQIELKQIFRQKDPQFIEILSAVRENRMTPELLDRLNARYIPDYQTPDGCITLCTHNFTAKNINETRLAQIKSPEYIYTATISGNFPESMYPQEVDLALKKGTQVMFTKNDPNPEKLYVNGSLGTVTELDEEHITVRLDEGGDIDVEPQPWENLKYDINEETKEIVSQIDGLFIQYPLKPAWAITIHKSQGLTFDKAVIDARHSFSHGQVYVALSRCRTLEGLVLKEKITGSSIVKDYRVKGFSEKVSGALPSAADLSNDQRLYYRSVLQELYGMEQLKTFYFILYRFIRATLSETYPKAIEQWKAAEVPFITQITEVGEKFNRSLNKIIGEDYLTSEYLQERIRKASAYFLAKGQELLIPLAQAARDFNYDDKQKKKLYTQYFTNFTEELAKELLMWNFTLHGFQLQDFLAERARLSAEISDQNFSRLLALMAQAKNHPGQSFQEFRKQSPDKIKPGTAASDAAGAVPEEAEDIANMELFKQLRDWRTNLSKENNVPAYCIIHQKPLIAIANREPSTKAELLAIKGVGKKLVEKYGVEIMEILDRFRSNKDKWQLQ